MGVALSIIFRVPGKKDDKLRSREKDIKIHSNKLIQEFKVSKSKLETEEKGWLTFFDKYKYTLEFEQHLSTGRNELFLSLDKFRIIELIYENLRYALERDLLDRLTAKCKELGISPLQTGIAPTFDDIRIISRLLEIVNSDSLKEFEAKTNESGKRVIVYDNEFFFVSGFDNILINRLVTALNLVIRDEEIKKRLRYCGAARQRYKELLTQFENDINDFLNDMDLSDKPIGGACKECLNFYSGKSKKVFQEKLGEYEYKYMETVTHLGEEKE